MKKGPMLAPERQGGGGRAAMDPPQKGWGPSPPSGSVSTSSVVGAVIFGGYMRVETLGRAESVF